MFRKSETTIDKNTSKSTIALCIAITVLMFILAGCTSTSTADDGGSVAEAAGENENTETNDETEEVTVYDASSASVVCEADYNGWHIAILDDGIVTTSDGISIFSITYRLTNNTGASARASFSDDFVYLYEEGDSFYTEATQNGEDLEGGRYKDQVRFSTSSVYDRYLLLVENDGATMEDGETLDFPVFFVLEDDSSEIILEVVDGQWGTTTLMTYTYTPNS